MDRARAVNGAMRALEIEGFVFGENEKADFAALATRKISYSGMLKKIDDNLAKLRKEKPEAFLGEG